ncbi:MAG: Putrescine transport system permease protein PotH [Firmicutes bacterium ADurb.Bin182]|nr:MAG: Putrescine transport system permease protein PotH [Firmicutes bacterium ADurb.Bin182]
MFRAKYNKMDAMLIPLALLFFIFFVIPFIMLLYNSFLTYTGKVEPGLPITVQNYIKFFKDSYYPAVIGRTFYISIVTTLMVTVLAYPLAYFMAGIKGYLKTIMLVLVTLPLISGVMVQNMGMYGMMTNYGTINLFLMALHIIEEPVQLLGNNIAVIIGLTQGFLPFMILPVMNALQAIPENVLQASESLGANKVRQFLHITLPMSFGGCIAGAVLVFGASLSSYTTPTILGRGKCQVIGTVVYQQAMQLFNWPFASSIAMLLLLLILLIVPITKILSRRRREGGVL